MPALDGPGSGGAAAVEVDETLDEGSPRGLRRALDAEDGLSRRDLDSAGRGCYNCARQAGPPDPSGKESQLRVRPEDSARLGGLLLGQRLVALGVVVDGQPVVGLLPYAVSDDLSSLIVQASALARHSKGLASGADWSGVVHEPDAAGSDPLQIPRLQLEGVVDPLREGRPEREAAARAFLRRFPNAATTLELPDFTLYRLEIRSGRMVLGFGSALNLSTSHFRDLRKGHE